MSGGRGCGENSSTSDWQCAFNSGVGVAPFSAMVSVDQASGF